MFDDAYATAWAAMLTLEPPMLSAFIQDAAAYHDKQAQRTGRLQRTPALTLRDANAFVPACAANPPGIRKGCSWPLFPLIGGEALNLAPSDRFLSREFLRRWQPGKTTLVYAAGCEGVRTMVAPLKLLVFKLGTHMSGDLSVRMRRLNAIQYGSERQSGGACDPGFGSWIIQPMEPRSAEAAPGSPVQIRNDALEIVLPVGLTNARFDQQLTRALCSASLENFARSRAGEAFCKGRGVDPAALFRASRVGKKTESARELVLFRPQQDLQRLVRVCEDLVYQFVMEATPAH